MATTSIRTAVARRIIELLEADGDLAGVDVRYGFPRDGLAGIGTDPSIFVRIGEEGGNTNTQMKAGRKPRDDEWEILVTVAQAAYDDDEGGLTLAERIETLFAQVENLFADNPTLQQDGEGISGLNWAVISGESDGPIITPAEQGNFVGWWSTTVACRARLS